MEFWEPIFLSFKLSIITTLLLLLLGVPLGYWLAHSRSRLRPVLESFVSLPLVLPPSVLGFYLLVAFSPRGAFGEFLQNVFQLRLLFSFEGLVVASVLYSLPFMVHPVQAGFINLSPSLRNAAYTLGASPMRTFTHVLLPNIKPALLSGIVLSFAHTMGEFGVVLMIGGNVPGVTKVASIAIYEEVESMQYGNAHEYAMVLVLISFLILLSLYWFNRKFFQKIR